MKKTGVINSQISAVIASMGHMDTLGIGDAGMPVPKDTSTIDLAVEKNLPSFTLVLKNVLQELQIQEVYIAEEIKTYNLEQLKKVQEIINVPIKFIPHEGMKEKLRSTKAFIRTGEMMSAASSNVG